MGRRRKIFKGVISYILALGLSVIFALFLNANVGWFMLLALTLAPMMSGLLAYITTKTIRVKSNIKECVLSKGDKCAVTVKIINRFIFPTAPIEIYVLNGDGVKSKDKRILCSVMPLSENCVTITFDAKICGPSYIGVEQICVTDYLGLMSFVLKKIDYSKLQGKVSVIPEIADISIRDDRLLKVMSASMNADDSEDTIDVSMRTFGGFPGYENREYVPGDPIKRINWKQSAKRDKLLVRLDDEMASKAVTLVVDSTFIRKNINVHDSSFDSLKVLLDEDEIIPKLAEDAVENALGIAKSLILSNYTVNMFVKRDETFVCYELIDDKDVENIRLNMASYRFLEDGLSERLPEELMAECVGMIISTPGCSSEIHGYLEGRIDTSKLSIFSATDEIKGDITDGGAIVRNYLNENKAIIKKKENIYDKMKSVVTLCAVPFILTMLLSITVFSVFDVGPWSVWILPQFVAAVAIFTLCVYTMNHKVVGGLGITVVVVTMLVLYIGIVGNNSDYKQWFMSGGELVDNKFTFLISLILVFTVFFGMVVFYYTKILYRTSALLLVSLIPFVIYVKVIKDIHIVYAMLVISFNVFTFLVNTRKVRDQGKRIVGKLAAVLSVIFYAAVFVLTALAVPKSQETKYYYIFEEKFLGGNTTVNLPEEYKHENEYSGNADGFNQLTNRKLYVIVGANIKGNMYFRRQVFDYYDKEINRWYKDEEYADKKYVLQDWAEEKNYLSSELLIDALLAAEELSEGFLEKYDLQAIEKCDITYLKKTLEVRAQNYESDTYITPLGIVNLSTAYGNQVSHNRHGILGADMQFNSKNARYNVEYYDNRFIARQWIESGGADFDNESALVMLKELQKILESGNKILYLKVVDAFKNDLLYAMEYNEKCSDNNEQISEQVRELAFEITSKYEYDWQKAEAIQNYFHSGAFEYDLEYDAEDDSIEHFLFESKRGTCSDFASAYVVMARAVGLTVRYVEGFVPSEEVGVRYDKEYVIRTNSSHAYPEVYIQNLGFMVYEPTVPAENLGNEIDGGAIMYAVTTGFRLLVIFALVSSVIIIVLFVTRIFMPIIKEKIFVAKVNRAKANEGIIMLYIRLIQKYSLPHIERISSNTPYEYASLFEELTGYDIGELCHFVEMAVYENIEMVDKDKQKALAVYKGAKKALRVALNTKK